jgi:hypothetical protein
MPTRKDRDRKRDKRRARNADPDGYVSESSPAAAGKYFQVLVPDWGQDAASPPNPLSSFIRLGNTTDEAPTTPFQTALVTQFTGFFDDPRQRADGATAACVQTLPGIVGAGSDGLGAAGVNDGGLSVTQRAAETDALQSKGGWMDHSDGNRITTTQGDKVEVVRGNYQLIVLGRQDSVSNAALLDISGGMMQPNDYTPANVMRLEWVRNYDGTWRIVEECQKGDVHNVVHGDVYEEQYGQSITSVTGSELQPVLSNPEQLVPFLPSPPAAPDTPNAADADGTADPAVITENNDLFDPLSPAYLGPTAQNPTNVIETKKNPVIVERTWAQSISGYTGSSTTRIPSIHEETWAQSITEVTDCSGTINSKTKASVVEEVTEVGSSNAVTMVGAQIEVTLAAAIAELTVAVAKVGISVIPLELEINVGKKWEFETDGFNKLHPSSQELDGVKEQLTATQTSLADTKAELAMTRCSVLDTSTRLAASETSIGEIFNFLAGEFDIG